jgi:hypothetical protein
MLQHNGDVSLENGIYVSTAKGMVQIAFQNTFVWRLACVVIDIHCLSFMLGAFLLGPWHGNFHV